MSDIEQRAKIFLLWLEQRILQREYTFGRIGYGRNRDLLQTEIAEAKQIRDRFLLQMQGTAAIAKESVFAPKVVPLRRQTNSSVPAQAQSTDADAAVDIGNGDKPPILH